MDFNLTETQKMVQDMVRRFSDTELARIADEVDRSEAFPLETLAACAPRRCATASTTC